MELTRRQVGRPTTTCASASRARAGPAVDVPVDEPPGRPADADEAGRRRRTRPHPRRAGSVLAASEEVGRPRPPARPAARAGSPTRRGRTGCSVARSAVIWATTSLARRADGRRAGRPAGRRRRARAPTADRGGGLRHDGVTAPGRVGSPGRVPPIRAFELRGAPACGPVAASVGPSPHHRARRVEIPDPPRVVVLVSGSGTLLQALLDAARAGYPARVVAVGADRTGIEGLARAERAGVPDVRAARRRARPTAPRGTPRSRRPSPSTAPTWSSARGS